MPNNASSATARNYIAFFTPVLGLPYVVRAAMQAIAVHYGKLYLHLVHFRACCSFLSSAIDLIINVCWEGRTTCDQLP